jgi:MYXO-CTERM domain-containing protein
VNSRVLTVRDFLVWEDLSEYGGADLRAALVARDGLTVRVTQIPVAADVGRQRRPGVGRAGSTHLVTWVLDEGAAVRARRVDLLGVVLDAAPISIAERELDSTSYPAAASNGQDFLVVWDAPSTQGGRDIRAARVKQDGTVLDPEGVVVWHTAGAISRPEVRSNGAHYLLAWSESGSESPGVRGLRVDASLNMLEAQSLLLGPAGGQTPDVATDGKAWLVVWDQGGAVLARRVDAGGALADAEPLLLAAGPGNELPDASSNGELYAVAWTHERAEGWYDLRATRVTADGAVLDPEGVLVAEASDHSGTMTCAIAAPGGAPRGRAAWSIALLLGLLAWRRRRSA